MIKFKKEVLTTIIILITFASLIWGAQSYLYSQFASAVEVQQLEKRLDTKILEDRLFTTQERIWKIEDRYHKMEIPPDVSEQLRILERERKSLEKELDIIRKK